MMPAIDASVTDRRNRAMSSDQSWPGDQSAHSDSQNPGAAKAVSASPTCWMNQM